MTDAITLIKEGKARLAELEKVAGQYLGHREALASNGP